MSLPQRGEAVPSTGLGSLEQFRGVEAERVKPWLSSCPRVLDIGAGSGYQASLFSAWGCAVTAIDPAPPPADSQHWPVRGVVGARLPFDDASFDVVFSSNVLEHVRGRHELLDEIRRVLSPNGRMIHVVPSASWRTWTSLARYVHIFRKLASSQESTRQAAQAAVSVSPRGLSHLLLGPPHGEFASAMSELWHFRRAAWRRLFERDGFELMSVSGNRLFYTGYTLWPALSLTARGTLSRCLGSSCHVFVVRVADRGAAR